MADIFLSYAREDFEKARLLAAGLERQGWSVVWEHASIPAGQDVDAWIKEAIAQARCMVVCWSAASIKSKWVIEEAQLGRERHMLLPVLFEPVSPPRAFSDLRTTDFSDWQGDIGNPEFLLLCDAITRLLAASQSPNPSADASAVSPAAAAGPPSKAPYASNPRFKLRNTRRPIIVLIGLAGVAMAWPHLSGLFLDQTLSATASKDQVCQFIPGQGPEMVVIPAGAFWMGAKDQNLEVIFTKPFAISRCEITFADYQAFVAATHREPPNDKGWGKNNRPVINVSWEDAVAYAQWLSNITGRPYRLPSEAEWEYAARAGTDTKFFWGDDEAQAKTHAWISENSSLKTQPVGAKGHDNPFGLYDMAGNVWEWTQDCVRGDNTTVPNTGAAWKEANKGDCTQRVLRGGSMDAGDPILMDPRISTGTYAGGSLAVIGIRLAQDLPTLDQAKQHPPVSQSEHQLVSQNQLQQIMPKCDTSIWLTPLNTAMARFEINTPDRIAAFLAVVAHESAETRFLSENLNYNSVYVLRKVWPRLFPNDAQATRYVNNPETLANLVYANRMGNGPEASGDGWRFHGRGLIRLTGRANYADYGEALNLPLTEQPDLLLAPSTAALAVAYFWKLHGLNELVDTINSSARPEVLVSIVKKTSGGTAGLQAVLSYFETAQRALQPGMSK